MIDWGYKVAAARQPGAQYICPGRRPSGPPATTGKPPIREQVIHFVNKRMPGGLPKRTARALLDNRRTVTTFPSSGIRPGFSSESEGGVSISPAAVSERLFLAGGTRHAGRWLWHVGVQTVLPPGYLCCGYPQRGAGRIRQGGKKIIHRQPGVVSTGLPIRSTTSTSRRWVVSCGTCFDQLQGYEFDSIFPGSKIMDIHEYLLEKGVTAGKMSPGNALHVPRPPVIRR